MFGVSPQPAVPWLAIYVVIAVKVAFHIDETLIC